jgi:hypothetical protein
MPNATCPSQEYPPVAKMTIRVYRVNRFGALTEDRGTVSVLPIEGPLPFTSAFPPCACPHCRVGEAATR